MSEMHYFDMDQALEDDTRLNLSIITSPEGLLLGRKTRGFGAGKLVLPGGKEKYMITGAGIAKRRTVDDIADELFQETGLAFPESSFSLGGYLYITDEEDETRDIVLARADLPHSPSLSSSDELSDIGWHPIDTLPYDDMPSDYKHWLPHSLSGRIVTAFLVNIDTDFSGSELYLVHEDPKNGPSEYLKI